MIIIKRAMCESGNVLKRVVTAVVLATVFAGGVHAAPVDAAVARQVAGTYMTAMGMKNPSALVDVTSSTPFTEFYIFAAPGGGFVIVSADDCVTPVLGYSSSAVFDAMEIPDNVRDVLEGYEREIGWWKQHAASRGATGTVAALWQMLADGQMVSPALTTAVQPLMTTTWNQRPYYNVLCPYDAAETGNHHVVTGCVATATAQIMKYHNHPATGYGSHSYTHATYGSLSADFGSTTYQWSLMPDALTATSSTAQETAVATLMYHIGVADEMNYGLAVDGGSSAFNYNWPGDELVPSSQSSLMAFFKYRPDMAIVHRDDYPDTEYCAILRNELDQSRPILFSGYDTAGGHSFVLHGYDNQGLFCVNWGWGGYFDGYFAIGGLVPAGGGAGDDAPATS